MINRFIFCAKKSKALCLGGASICKVVRSLGNNAGFYVVAVSLIWRSHSWQLPWWCYGRSWLFQTKLQSPTRLYYPPSLITQQKMMSRFPLWFPQTPRTQHRNFWIPLTHLEPLWRNLWTIVFLPRYLDFRFEKVQEAFGQLRIFNWTKACNNDVWGICPLWKL